MISEILKNLPRRKKKILYGALLVVSDIAFLALSYYLSYYLRFYTKIFGENKPTYSLDKNYVFYSVIFISSAIFIFFLFNLYDWDNIYRGSGYYTRIIRAISINIIVIIIFGYLFETFSFSRIWIFLLFFISIFLLGTSRFTIEITTQKLLSKFGLSSKVLVVGVGENARRIEDSLRKYSKGLYEVVGYLDKVERLEANKKYLKKFLYSKKSLILGRLEDLRDIVINSNVQRVIISSPEYNYYEVLDILEKLKGLDVSVLVFPGFFEFSIRRMTMREICGIPLMQIKNIGFFGINLFYKNVVDYLLGAILFLFFIPIYLIGGVMIKVDSKGPVLFKQKRYTKDFKEFYIYKFRTMYTDAEERLKELADYNEADGPLFKMKDDPRVTRVGRFLRRFSFDELPQIINVLRGELSLVGPRPPIPEEVEQYDKWQKKRLNVKQGITGLWQISGRSELSFEEMVKLDLYYIQNWSITLDIKILLKTIPAVLFRRGAY
ncbi:hypothetical protein ES707_03689 [subsurface metagenome]